jgi:heptosyltransferase-2
MSMPALQAYRAAHPDERLILLVKPAMAPLWAMHPAPDEILQLASGFAGARRAAAAIRRAGCRRAYVLPHSFRAALVPFLARVPKRIGRPGHARDFLLTEVVRATPRAGQEHQAYEMLALLAPDASDALEPPHLEVDAVARAAARELLGEDHAPWIGLIPGAARGPSKQWPRAHFEEVGRRLDAEPGARLAVLGTPAEMDLCASVARAIGPAAVSFAGRTSFAQWAGLLECCTVVVANDSGGMHLAAALGTPVVAMFGITDPTRTGPLGPARILQHARQRSRDVPRDSDVARLSLASIQPEEVYDAVLEQLASPG